MPALRRKYARRALRRKRSTYRKRKSAFLPRRVPRNGSMFIIRKVKPLASAGTGVAGSYTINPNNSVVLGTPQLEPAGTSMYSVPFSVVFRLDELQSYTELTNLFDQFKIVFGRVKIQFTQTSGTNNTIPIPYVDYIADHDDGSVPTIGQMREKMGVRTKYSNTVTSHVTLACKPKVAMKAQATAAGLVLANIVPGQTWINSTYPETEHYAIKGVIRNVNIPATGGVAPITWDVEMGVALKDVQ